MKVSRILFQGTPEEILTKDLLREAYGEGIEIARHPESGRPMVLPAHDMW